MDGAFWPRAHGGRLPVLPLRAALPRPLFRLREIALHSVRARKACRADNVSVIARRGYHHHVDRHQPTAEAPHVGRADYHPHVIPASSEAAAVVIHHSRVTTVNGEATAAVTSGAAAATSSAYHAHHIAAPTVAGIAGAFNRAQPTDNVVVATVDADAAPAVCSVLTASRLLAFADGDDGDIDDGIDARR